MLTGLNARAAWTARASGLRATTQTRFCDCVVPSTGMRAGIMHVSGRYYARTSGRYNLSQFSKHIKCSLNNTPTV